MGADGHTASIFPGTGVIAEADRLVAAAWVGKFSAHRITLTPPVLNNAACVLFIVGGAEKADALRAVLSGAFNPDRFPAQAVLPTNGRLLWLVDRAAAGRLEKGGSVP
jgi:6-phosphogluconolactonase